MSYRFKAVPGEPTVVMSREFAAPRDLVFEVFSAAEHVNRWWSCQPLASCEVDLREGGSYRYVDRRDGQEFAFSGDFHEIEAPEKLVYCQVFEAFPDSGSLVTVTFAEQGDKTIMTETVAYPSVEIRDTVIETGIKAGAAESFDRIAALLATLTEDP